MPGLPVAVNKNLNNATNQLPIAGDTGISGALGGIKADGTSILVDEITGVASAAGGPGAISGTLTPGVLPVASAPHVLGDSPIDFGVTTPQRLTVIKGVDLFITEIDPAPFDGINININYDPVASDSGTSFAESISAILNINGDNGTGISAATCIDAEIYSKGVTNPIPGFVVAVYGYAENDGAAAVSVILCMEADGDNSGGQVTDFVGLWVDPLNLSNGPVTNLFGINVQDQINGTNVWAIKTGLGLVEFGDNLKVHKLIQAGTIYSVAGTALPAAATAGIGARAFVSDATVSVFHSAYVGGGANKVPVFSDGANWLIG